MMDKERKKRIVHSLMAAGAGTAAGTATGAVTSPAIGRLVSGLSHSEPHVSVEDADTLGSRMLGRHREILLRKPEHFPKSKSGLISMPLVPPESADKVSLPSLAHEIGHAHGGALQRLSSAVGEGLYGTAGVGKYRLPLMVSPAHAALAVGAATPKSKKSKVLRWLQSHPATLAAGLAAIPLAGEAHASVRALKGIHKTYGSQAAKQSILPLAKGFGTHALSHAPAVAGLAVMSKIRDWLEKKRESKALEKKGEAAGGGAVGRVVDRPLGTYKMPVQWSDYPWMNSGVVLQKPRRKQADPDRPEILQSGTSTMLGVQE